MTRKNLNSVILAVMTSGLLAACATTQENPNYQYSTQYNGDAPNQMAAKTGMDTGQNPLRNVTYRGDTPTNVQTQLTQSQAPIVYQAVNGGQNAATYTRVNHECLSRETNRQLLGGAIGGTIGAVAGKKWIGGTKGAVLGAAVGGTAGYGVGDVSINCDPIPVTVPTASTTTYQSAPQQTPGYKPYSPGQDTYSAPTDQAYGDTTGTPGYDAMMAANEPAPSATPTYVYPSATAPSPVASSQPAPSPFPASGPIIIDARANETSGQFMAPGSTHRVVKDDTVYSLSRARCVGLDEIQSLNSLDGNYSINLGQTLILPASRC